jgi:hypothetical protein
LTKLHTEKRQFGSGLNLTGWKESSRIHCIDNHLRHSIRAAKWIAVWITAAAILNNLSALAQTQEVPAEAPTSIQLNEPPGPKSGSISGIVVDQSGAVVADVKITLAQQGMVSKREALSDSNGYFLFLDVAPGPFQIAYEASGFATVQTSGVLQPGENYIVPQITLAIPSANVDVEVRMSSEQVAEEEVKVEEKQRVLGVIPNFYVSYVPNAAPLTTKLKFQLAWKSTIDPFSFLITGAIAGVQQAENDFSGYGQGVTGYARRYGAAYGDFVSGTFIGGAILPSLLKQDPRYFYKGIGSRKSRFFYAIANAVICKGDNGRWQPNYSGIIGGLAAGGISNLYYPAENRNGASLTFENALIGIGGGAASNIIQEFIVRRFTPHLSAQDPAKQ